MIKIVSNKEVFIDDCDDALFEKYKWSVHPDGYVGATNYYVGTKIGSNGNVWRKQKKLRLHRYLLNIQSKDKMVDHMNGNRLDNRRCNLRLVNYLQNAQNRCRDFNKKSCLPKGVYASGYKNKKYRVRVQTNKVRHEGGYFVCIGAAVLKYNEIARKVFGEFMRLSR